MSAFRRLRPIGCLCLTGALVLVVTYLIMGRTSAGQAFGDAAYLARRGEVRGLRVLDKALLGMIDLRVVILVAVALLAIGLILRRARLGVAVTAGFSVAMVAAEVLKRTLPRPVLAPAMEALMGSKEGLNTYPSGHVTLAAGLALGVVILAPARARPWLAMAGLVLAGSVGIAVVVAGWHRPSDAIGGIALALTCMAAVAGWAVARWPDDDRSDGRSGSVYASQTAETALPWFALGLVLATAALLVLTQRWADPAHFPSASDVPVAHPWTLVIASVAIMAWAALAVVGVARSLKAGAW